jgi:hypothetical protein
MYTLYLEIEVQMWEPDSGQRPALPSSHGHGHGLGVIYSASFTLRRRAGSVSFIITIYTFFHKTLLLELITEMSLFQDFRNNFIPSSWS